MKLREWTPLGRALWLGAPVFVHWTILVPVGLAALMALGSLVHATLFLVSYLGIIVTHELGHAFVARRLGYRVDGIGITALHGWCMYEAQAAGQDEMKHALFICSQNRLRSPTVAVPSGGKSWSLLSA